MNSGKKDNIAVICKYLPAKLSEIIKSASEFGELCEIRLRADMPVSLVFADGKRFITESGRLTLFDSQGLIKISKQEIEEIFRRMCAYSVHSFMDSLTNGFITLDGGSRVGVYGTAVTKDSEITSVRNICGMNIRVSGNFTGIAEPLWESLYKNGAVNTLICGPPSSGKTTLLRDIARLLSDKGRLKVAAVDERRELCGGYLGANTDVLESYPKAKGVEIAVRTLSPEVIICDEIGSVSEIESVTQGMNSGVRFIMSMHCRDSTELVKKPQFAMLRRIGAVEACVFLGGGFRIKEILYETDISGGNSAELLYGGTVRSIQA
ncbi:MAG: AAA family ATPase [Clostridia bacterium]|nr:AAA family ATPase [Clostridia bacterium]